MCKQSVWVLVKSTAVQSSFQQALNLEEISQYYIFPEKSSQMDCYIYDLPKLETHLDPELPLLGHSSSLQTFFSIRASGKPNYLGARVAVPTHWDLDLLDSLLEGYEDRIVADLLHYGWPMSRSLFPHQWLLTCQP